MKILRYMKNPQSMFDTLRAPGFLPKHSDKKRPFENQDLFNKHHALCAHKFSRFNPVKICPAC